MTLFLRDVSVWVTLSEVPRVHWPDSSNWLRRLSQGSRVIFCRYTQLGLLRLLTNQIVMGEETLTLQQAWSVYDEWLEDPRINLHAEPHGIDESFRGTTRPFAAKAASKWVGDCYLLAYADACGATLVTFDKGLLELARKHGYTAIPPA